jgi:RNA polymerase sigma-70 factor (ECF subfamily)
MVSRSQFEQTVLQHRHAAFNLAYWILQNRDEAEDAVQDAYIRAFRAFDTFAGGDARAWLLAIVRNVAYSALGARKRLRNVIKLSEDLKGETPGDGFEAVSPEPSPEAVLIVRQEHRRVVDALSALPPIQRDILLLREVEGLSYKEIAEITGTTMGTVMSRLSRARAELRRALAAYAKSGLSALL